MVIYNTFGGAGITIFLVYELFGVFVILNVIIGVFIDSAIKIADEATEREMAATISEA